METRMLHYFIVLTQVGNITAAADALHVTQPTLSRQFDRHHSIKDWPQSMHEENFVPESTAFFRNDGFY